MDRVIEQLPRFLSPLNLWFLTEAMGMTLALTFFGCGLGFLLAFIVVAFPAALPPDLWPTAPENPKAENRKGVEIK